MSSEENGAKYKDSSPMRANLASITGPKATSLCEENERKDLVEDMDLNNKMWKLERDRNSVPEEHFDTWKGVVRKTPEFSWTIEELPTNTWRKWPLYQQNFDLYECSVRMEQLEDKPGEVGVKIFVNAFKDWFPKPKLFVVLRAKNEAYKDSLAQKFFGYLEMLKKDYESHFLCATYPKSLLLHHGYNSNNSVTLDFYLEQEWSTQFVLTYGGELFWTIDNFPRIGQDPDLQFFSPYFYTTPNGYRIQAIISRAALFFNVRIAFLNGKFDYLKQNKVNYDLKVRIATPDFLICMGEYSRYNIRDLKFCMDLGKYQDIAMHNTVCFIIEVIMK